MSRLNKGYAGDHVCSPAATVKIAEKKEIEYFLENRSLACPPRSEPKKQPDNRTPTIPPAIAFACCFSLALLSKLMLMCILPQKSFITTTPDITPV